MQEPLGFLFAWFLKTGFPCVTLAVLELGSVDQAGLEFQRSACLGLLSAGHVFATTDFECLVKLTICSKE